MAAFKQFHKTRHVRLALLMIACCLLAGPALAAPPGTLTPGVPRLAVLVVFDQFRGDYFDRWRSLFEKEGFERLLSQGAWFKECHFPYAFTFTGPGHASFLTGCCPNRHGIISNEWYDRLSGTMVSCVGETQQEGAMAREVKKLVTPERLLSPTLAESLKKATGGRGRVVSLSLKDRSAVLPVGRQTNACYWLGSNGQFVTSSFYRDLPHAWVTRFNWGHPADRWYGKTWDRLRPDLDYGKFSGPDDVEGEGKGIQQGRVFPHPFPKGLIGLSKLYYSAVYNSPFGNELLLELAREAIVAEKLGKDEIPDLLCLSFSCNDSVGHTWGPDSQEVLDVTLRSDRIVRDLLKLLDEEVGKEKYLLVLTADHGVCPLPQLRQAAGQDAGWVAPELLASRAEELLVQKFGTLPSPGRWLLSFSNNFLYLNRELMEKRGLSPSQGETALADWVKQQPGILTAYTRAQLSSNLPAQDDLGRRVQLSFHPDRSGDVAVVQKPYYLLAPALLRTGTTHGTPFPYDTHVPLVVFGPGAQPGVHREPVAPQATAAIMAHWLRISPPADAVYPVPNSLFALKK